ncbi:hypothetical protein ACJIZ3_013425 [Penstemon smallii]|uniref:WRKY domain-containing protein n=1 Tax=Penstemon smallii TaxID=265156 RepID=A0ABD3USS3_9LAMI
MMEKYDGDLTDIVGGSGRAEEAMGQADEWQPLNNNNNNNLSEDFGVPAAAFTHLGSDDHLLLHHDDMEISSTPPAALLSGLVFHSLSNNNNKSPPVAVEETNNNNNNNNKRRSLSKNIFSRMLQISPNPKFPVPSPPLPNNNNNSFKAGCLVQSPPASLQISSPPNTAIKRRKSQLKKVVCIPAPAPANMMSSSRPSGEVVPSDLWAWRKYGQKPIKGSPYPRGYYRCSSSKGCLARKQVERSRTDPNMLVITYTSEHNHPWPTQRNALAGSTRSHHHHHHHNHPPTKTSSTNPINNDQKELFKKVDEANSSSAVKEEGILDQLQALVDPMTMTTSYKPTLPNLDHHDSEDSFFADLGEIEGGGGGDPNLDMLFAQEFINSTGGGGGGGGGDRSSIHNNKGASATGTCNLIHPFSFVDYDWAVNNNNSSSSSTSYNGPGNKKANIYIG